jgi:hypothetical protein
MLVLFAFSKNAFSDEASPGTQFLGMNSCSSSSCHGGAAAKKNECVIWLKQDFHSRAFATLTTARSARLGEVLKISSPKTDANCTSCHAPFQTLPPTLQGKGLDVIEGVSCESCHGPAESWLRSHTRTDFTHADRVNAGMRDLENIYVRANSCVACHQNVSSNLLAAGHPALIFELDGQSVSEPKHWRESTNWSGAQTWLVGQAVALREIKWQLSREKPTSKAMQPDAPLIDRGDALFWLLQKISSADSSLPAPSFLKTKYSSATIQKWADELARAASGLQWTKNQTRKYLTALAASASDFRDKTIDPSLKVLLSRRAERLVLGLDRLVQSSEKEVRIAVEAELNQLFLLVQSLPDFDSSRFADALEKFSSKLATKASE